MAFCVKDGTRPAEIIEGGLLEIYITNFDNEPAPVKEHKKSGTCVSHMRDLNTSSHVPLNFQVSNQPNFPETRTTRVRNVSSVSQDDPRLDLCPIVSPRTVGLKHNSPEPFVLND